MAANNPARRGVAFTFSVRLPSQANTKINKVNPTLATGDVKVSKDGGGDTNMTTLPSVIGGGTEVIGTLSAAEMTADLVSVVFSDVAGAEWCDYHVLIFPEQAERGVLNKTTIATLASQVSFTLTAGSADNDAYNGCVIIVEDATTAAQKAVGVVLDYVGSTKTITLLTDPAVFTMAVGDVVTIMASRVSQQVLDVAAASHNTANSIGAKINAAGVGVTAAEVWSHTSRTLTSPAGGGNDTQNGPAYSRRRGDTWSIAVTGLGNISTRTKLWFTIKNSVDDADGDSILQIVEGTGLTILNAAAGTAGQGSITVSDAVAGNLTIAVNFAATKQLTPRSGRLYDIQVLEPTGVRTIASCTFDVTADVTRATS